MGKVLFGTTIPDAADVPYDNTIVGGLVAENAQSAIDELIASVAQGASPGFTYGRSGNLPANTWLLNEGVPSNLSGRFVYTTDTVIRRVFVSNQDISTFDVSIYHHLGDETSLTFLFNVSVVAARGGSFTINQACPTGVQLATRITGGSAKQAVVGLDIKGSV